MKLFLLTSHDSDNSPILVNALDKTSAITQAALTGLNDDLVENSREDEDEKISDKDLFARALQFEINFIKDQYDCQEIEMAKLDEGLQKYRGFVKNHG